METCYVRASLLIRSYVRDRARAVVVADAVFVGRVTESRRELIRSRSEVRRDTFLE